MGIVVRKYQKMLKQAVSLIDSGQDIYRNSKNEHGDRY